MKIQDKYTENQLLKLRVGGKKAEKINNYSMQINIKIKHSKESPDLLNSDKRDFMRGLKA